jgi:molecular chaperone GrpE|nr:nucleotide exchange factor GrpE [uncultured Undibacterium sp.]
MQEQEKTVENNETIATSIEIDPAQINTPGEAVSAQVAEPAFESVNEPGVSAATLAQLEAKVLELQDAFMRAKAEGENIRRRAQEDISKAHKFAIESFAESLVPVKDSLEMGLKIETQTVESIKEGVEMTLKQLNSAFEKNRLLEINPQQGDKLDPTKHQAVSMVPAEQEANTIVAVLQKGYTIADRLLRPALVTVAQAK